MAKKSAVVVAETVVAPAARAAKGAAKGAAKPTRPAGQKPKAAAVLPGADVLAIKSLVPTCTGVAPAPALLFDTPFIEVYGAREHNLKNVTVQIPRNKLVVFTGISGSGKSSLAFDTIYAEGQRRYMETFSAYARSFMGGQIGRASGRERV